ncbi:MAG: threonine synthase [Anaerolineaceae bacterium]|nr:threonine synthase [Anaerolineaceae bacterium]
MEKFSLYKCSLCGKEYAPDEVTYTCPLDGGNLDIIYDYELLKKKISPDSIFNSSEYSIWRYIPLLPIEDPGCAGSVLRSVGWTPLYKPDALARELNINNLWIKDDGRNPTASFKDRASAVVVARAKEINAEVVVTASTGNAGAALAGMAAAVHQKAVIFAPKTAPPAKIAQLLIFGAQVFLVNGNYDQAFDLSIKAADTYGWYCRNTGYNPFTAEGKKTAALEIWEQVIVKEDLPNPLCIFVSVGDGNIISGIHKGFKDLIKLGWIKRMPRIFGVQSEGSAAIANAFNAGTEEIIPVQASTIADSISVDQPRDGLRALRAVAQTNGTYVKVSDLSILAAIARLGREGIFAEPAAATAYAGLQKAVADGLIQKEDPALVLITGSGLKDIKAAERSVQAAPIIEPSLSALKKAMG